MLNVLFAETKAHEELAAAHGRVVALKHALSSGANVDRELREAQADLESLKRNLVRGDIWTLCILGGFIGVSVVSVYAFASNLMLVQLWRTPQHPYLTQFRPDAACIWRTCQILSGSNWLILGPVALVGVLWGMQRRLERRLARRILCGLLSAVILFDAMLLFTFFRLLQMPLG